MLKKRGGGVEGDFTFWHLPQRLNWDVVGVAETWLDNTISDGKICIPGYSVVRCDRSDRQGGGTCLYYRTSLPVTYRSDLHHSHLEATWTAIGGRHTSTSSGWAASIARRMQLLISGATWTQSSAILLQSHHQ